MYYNPEKYAEMPLGVVVRRVPGVTKWAPWAYAAVAVLPGAGEAAWKVLRQDGDVTEFHAATVRLQLHGAEAEAYLNGLSADVPSIYVVMRPAEEGPHPYDILLATASPYESQDYDDSGEEIVEKIPMPEGLVAWVRDFAFAHYEEEEFKKRRRDKKRIDRVEDGIGDARISQMTDVYRAPRRRKEDLH